MNDILEARIKAANKANQIGNDLYQQITKALRPFINQRIVKADGSLTIKAISKMPALPNTPNLRVYQHKSNSSLAWTIYVSEPISVGSVSHEVTLYVAELSGDVLLAFHPMEPWKTDYTIEEVINNRAAYAEAKRKANDLLNRLHPFGEFDRP
jgi:hypothetical protein